MGRSLTRDEVIAHEILGDACEAWRVMLANGTIAGDVEDREHDPRCRRVAAELTKARLEGRDEGLIRVRGWIDRSRR